MSPREQKKQAIQDITDQMVRLTTSVTELINRYAGAGDFVAIVYTTGQLLKDIAEMNKIRDRIIKTPIEDYHALPELIPLNFTDTKPVPQYPKGWKDGTAMVVEKGKEIIFEVPNRGTGTYQDNPIRPMRHVINIVGRAGGKTTQYNEMLKNIQAHQALITPLVKPKK